MEFKVISALQEKDVWLIVSQVARTKGRRLGSFRIQFVLNYHTVQHHKDF